MTRIEEIAAKHKGYEDETRPTCDVNFLLDELKDREEKLAAVKKFTDLNLGPLTRKVIDRILYPKGE